MTRGDRGHRRRHRLRDAALILPLLAPLLLTGAPASSATPATPATRPAATAPGRGDVQVRIDDVSPSVVARSTTRQPLRIRVTLTNTSGSPLTGVRIKGVRGEPIGSQKALDASIADTSPPDDGLDIPATTPVQVNLPTSSPVTTTFVTTISILSDGGLCQCATAVYPIRLTASAARSGGGTVVLGSATTYVPSELDPVTPVKVSWVWPLLDRPHRLASDTVFTDDDLASSVSGGRLDRALQVIEGLKATTPVTLVVDPELLDELEVMAAGSYTVRTGSGTTPGTGQAAARAWLDRFAAVLSSTRAVQVSLTPYADPDIQTLAADDLTWATELPDQMQQRVTSALAGRPSSTTDVAWPAGGTLSRKALDAMAASGVKTVVVDGSALSRRTVGGLPVAVARLRSTSGSLTAAATSPVMQRQVAQAVEVEQTGTTGANVLPYLLAEIAVRAVQSGDDASQAVLTPPRYVDPAPDRAIRTIEDTSSNAFTAPIAVRALSALRPGRVSTLRAVAPASASAGLPAANLAAARQTGSSLPLISSLLSRDPDAQPLVAGLAGAEQRVTSSAWRPVSGSQMSTSDGPALARDLSDDVDNLLRGVRIVSPSSGSYTLGSEDSKLPITVENTLPYTVVVGLDVRPQDDLPGFTTRDIGTKTIAPDSKQTLQVPSRLDRSGKIPVRAELNTPSGDQLDESVVYVRSTVFGTIGIVITFVAGGVLALALVVRLVRRLQRLRRKADRAARDDDAGAHPQPASAVGTSRT